MARCNICGTQLANAPSWLDDIGVFTCPNCKSDDGVTVVTPVEKSDKKSACPSCGGTNIVDNDENSLRCDDCGVELCKLCEAELVTVDDTRECKGCGSAFPNETGEDGAEEAVEGEDYDT